MVVELLKTTLLHWLARLAALGEPKPGGHVIARAGVEADLGLRQRGRATAAGQTADQVVPQGDVLEGAVGPGSRRS